MTNDDEDFRIWVLVFAGFGDDTVICKAAIVDNQYAIYFDLNGFLRYAYLGWIIFFAVWPWRMWRNPLYRVFAWMAGIALLSILDGVMASELPLNISTSVDNLAYAMTALPFALLDLVLMGRLLFIRWPSKNVTRGIFMFSGLIVLGIFFAWLILFGVSPWLSERIGGRRYNLADPRDAQRLRLFAYDAQPLINALERFERDNGHFPEHVGELSPRYLDRKYLSFPDGSTPMFGEGPLGMFYYQAESTDRLSYSLYRKMNWDASLRYTCGVKGRNRWYYDPADGASAIHLPVPMDAK